MKRVSIFLALLPLVGVAAPLPNSFEQPKLIGMMSWDGTNSVWLTGREHGRWERVIRLHRGEENFGVRVISIAPQGGDVTIETGTQKRIASALPKPLLPAEMAGRSTGVAILAMQLEAETVVELVGLLSGRTVLRPEALPGGRLDVDIPLADTATALQSLKSLLAKAGIQAADDGDKFLLVAAAGFPLGLLPKPVRPAQIDRPTDIGVGSGELLLRSFDVNEFLDRICPPFYGGPISRDPSLSSAKITLLVRNTLTRAELLHAYERVLNLNGIAIQASEDKTLRALRLQLAAQN